MKVKSLFYRELGRTIREARLASKLTQHALADKICMSRPSLNHIEAGKQRVQVHQLIRIASVLQISVEELLTS